MSTTTTSTTTVTDTPAGLPPEAIIVAIALVAVLIVLLLLARRRAAVRTETRIEEPVVREPLVEAPPAAPLVTSPPPPIEPKPLVTAAGAPIAIHVSPPAPPTPTVDPAPLAPAVADDFTRMKGVGPKLATQLAGLGYTRFEQIASLTPDQADALDAQLGNFRGRLVRDRWIEQAGYLAKNDTAGFEGAFGRL